VTKFEKPPFLVNFSTEILLSENYSKKYWFCWKFLGNLGIFYFSQIELNDFDIYEKDTFLKILELKKFS